jgi:hypothetical protein
MGLPRFASCVSADEGTSCIAQMGYFSTQSEIPLQPIVRWLAVRAPRARHAERPRGSTPGPLVRFSLTSWVRRSDA